MKETIIVGLSGGVDSAVSALLLKEQGFKVQALFMKNWEEDDSANHCTATEDLQAASRVCKTLDIPLHTANFSSEYWNDVFAVFLSELKAGRTPNPDVLCNREIKFKAFFEHARKLGAKRIATGHYARLVYDNNTAQLAKAEDHAKDQSYFLHTVPGVVLKDVLFPLGDIRKQEVRTIAQQAGLPNYARRDSTGICFIGERRFDAFLERYFPKKPGPVLTVDGQQVGTHHGLMFHTIGQRKGLGLGGVRGANEAPWYVADKKMAENTLIVAQGHDHPALYHNALTACDLHWISGAPPPLPASLHAKIRYRQADQLCSVSLLGNGHIQATFKQPQRAITPGQSIVLYDNDLCLGGGIIATRAHIKEKDMATVASQL